MREEGNRHGRRGGEKAWKHHRGDRGGIPGKTRPSGKARKPVENPMMVAHCDGHHVRVVRRTAKPVVCTEPLWQVPAGKAKQQQRNRRRSQQRRNAFANAA